MSNTNEITPATRPNPADVVSQLTRAGAWEGSMADLARFYVLAGIPVFPADSESKSPLVPGGFKARSSDLNVVGRWWDRWPNALIGLVPADVGLAAIDVDKTEHARAARASGHLSRAVLVVETGGKSVPFVLDGNTTIPPLHVYVSAVAGAPKIGGGVVVRHDAGYVIAPGSRRPNGRAWRVQTEGLGLWPALTSIPQTDSVDVPVSVFEKNRDVGGQLRAPDVSRVREAVARIPNGPDLSRDEYVAMAHKIRGAVGPDNVVAGLGIFKDWAAKWSGGTVNPVEDERVYNTLVDSAIRTGWPQLHRAAADYGYDNEADVLAEVQLVFPADSAAGSHPARSLHPQLVEIRRDLLAIDDPIEREAALIERLGPIAQRYRLRMGEARELLSSLDAATSRPAQIKRVGSEMFADLAETPHMLARGFVFAQQQHVLFGEPASFKTFVALDLGLSVASGRRWLGRVPTRKTGVVFFAGEAAPSVHVRIAAWAVARGISPEEMGTIPFVVIDEVPRFGHNDGGLEKAVEQVREAERLTGTRVGFVILDNMTRILARAGASNTDVGEFGRVLSGLDEFAHQASVATLTIAHSPVSDSNRPSGTFQGLANPDFIYLAKRDDDDNALGVTIRTMKSRGARPTPAVHITLGEHDATALVVASHHALSRPIPTSLSPGSVFVSEEEIDTAQFVSLAVSEGIPVAIAKKQLLTEQLLALLKEGEQPLRTIRKRLKGAHLEKDRTLAGLVRDGVIVERRGQHGARMFSLPAETSMSGPVQEAA